MEKINWCKSVKGGIELVEPNTNLANGYILKAEESLNIMQKAKDSRDWSVSTSYYTMYFSLYSILMKIGVKCEIHACTIEFMKRFLPAYFTPAECKFISDSLKARVDTQYYVDRDIKDKFVSEMLMIAPNFLIKCKEILARIKESEINTIRKEVKKL